MSYQAGKTYWTRAGDMVQITGADENWLYGVVLAPSANAGYEGEWNPDGTWLIGELVSGSDLMGEVVGTVKEQAGEADPSGISASTPGAKLDAGKLLPRLVLGEFARALTEVVKVGTKGARKYSPRGWLTVDNGIERYAEAADRHQLEVNKGVVFDSGPGGTGERHKAQVIWNLLANLELELREEERNHAE